MTKLSDVVRGVEVKELGVEVPTQVQGLRCKKEGYNSLANAEVVVLEDKIQDVLVRTFGCKPTKEDCSFESCKSWGRCECLRSNFTAAVSSGSMISLKEKE